MRNFNVKEMARDAVISFFQDPETREAFKESRETFAENLHQYRHLHHIHAPVACPYKHKISFTRNSLELGRVAGRNWARVASRLLVGSVSGVVIIRAQKASG